MGYVFIILNRVHITERNPNYNNFWTVFIYDSSDSMFEPLLAWMNHNRVDEYHSIIQLRHGVTVEWLPPRGVAIFYGWDSLDEWSLVIVVVVGWINVVYSLYELYI